MKDRSFKDILIDENYFKIIDSEEKAYFLGLLYADGGLYTNSKNSFTFFLTLNKKDKYMLKKIKYSLRSKRKIKNIGNNCFRLYINNRSLFNDLCLLGCRPNKWFKIRMPFEKIPHDLMYHFIRGYFDGDGCITYPIKQTFRGEVSITSNINFCKDIEYYLNKLLNLSFCKINPMQSKSGYSYGSLRTVGRKNLQKFYNYIYKNAKYFLIRKKLKFEEFFNLQKL